MLRHTRRAWKACVRGTTMPRPTKRFLMRAGVPPDGGSDRGSEGRHAPYAHACCPAVSGVPQDGIGGNGGVEPPEDASGCKPADRLAAGRVSPRAGGVSPREVSEARRAIVMNPGRAREARRAASRGPSRNHRSSPVLRSVATAVESSGRSSIRTSPRTSLTRVRAARLESLLSAGERSYKRSPSRCVRARTRSAEASMPPARRRDPHEGAHGAVGEADDVVAALLKEHEDPDVAYLRAPPPPSARATQVRRGSPDAASGRARTTPSPDTRWNRRNSATPCCVPG